MKDYGGPHEGGWLGGKTTPGLLSRRDESARLARALTARGALHGERIFTSNSTLMLAHLGKSYEAALPIRMSR
ncbi:hypothetical protein [Hyalangium sp.]|uniref:hypothetical protein n=1 Tax=Hyalangium sp. TaxID=2028555 RepID=UPI00389AE6DB